MALWSDHHFEFKMSFVQPFDYEFLERFHDVDKRRLSDELSIFHFRYVVCLIE